MQTMHRYAYKYVCRHTGWIGNRQQLAAGVLVGSWGCSGGAQRACGDHLHQIQRRFDGKPELLKIGRFFLHACGNGVNLPHVAKHAFGDQMAPNVQKAMPFGSPPHQGLKIRGLSPKHFFSTLFRAHRGAFRGLRAGHISWLAYYSAAPAAPGRLNATWV